MVPPDFPFPVRVPQKGRDNGSSWKGYFQAFSNIQSNQVQQGRQQVYHMPGVVPEFPPGFDPPGPVDDKRCTCSAFMDPNLVHPEWGIAHGGPTRTQAEV